MEGQYLGGQVVRMGNWC